MAASKTKGPRAGTKTAFILAHGEKPAHEIVTAGKAAGLAFSSRFVYAARSKAKSAADRGANRTIGIAKRAAAARAKLAAKGIAPTRRTSSERDGAEGGPVSAAGSLESQFAAIAVELGISRAEAILRRVRDALAKLTF